MNDVSSGSGALRSTVRSVRLPLVVLTALLTMGSGWGNPGCGSGGEDVEYDCLEGCEIQGTYQLTYEDTSPLGPDCDKISAALPPGPLVLERDGRNDSFVTTRVAGMQLQGTYLGVPDRNLLLEGAGILGTSGAFVRLRFDGAFPSGPQSASEPATFSGTFALEQDADSSGQRCVVTRAFTATR